MVNQQPVSFLIDPNKTATRRPIPFAVLSSARFFLDVQTTKSNGWKPNNGALIDSFFLLRLCGEKIRLFSRSLRTFLPHIPA